MYKNKVVSYILLKMEDSVDLEQAKEIYDIDIGGTPANVLEKGKLAFLLSRGIKQEQIIFVVDPFDLSRVERALIVSDVGTVKRFKFQVKVPGTERISSEYIEAPDRKQVLQLFQDNKGKIVDALSGKYKFFKKDQKALLSERYELMKSAVLDVADSSKNLREFMNSLIQVLSPVPIKLKKLESVLIENQEKVYDILKQRSIEARVFCPDCGRMVPYTFNNENLRENICCSVTAEDVIKKGSYVPEEGMLPTVLYLCGITPCVGRDSSYGAKALDIVKSLGKLNRPFIRYTGEPNKTMFEDFMLREIK